MFVFKKNEVTGAMETSFSGTLRSVPTKWQPNVNGKEYGTCSIEFLNAQGNSVIRPANIWKANYAHGMKIGEQYLCTARKADNGSVYLSVSHLQGSGEFASQEDFGFAGAIPTVNASPVVREENLAKSKIGG